MPRQPASVRHRNPTAQYPGPSARRFGSTGHAVIGGGHKIATFANPVMGAAAGFDLLRRRYAGMSLDAAIKKWTGSNASRGYYQGVQRATGLRGSDRITSEMVAGPVGLALVKAMARHEAGQPFPLSDEQWSEAQRLAFKSAPHIDNIIAAGRRVQQARGEVPSAEAQNQIDRDTQRVAFSREGPPPGPSAAAGSAPEGAQQPAAPSWIPVRQAAAAGPSAPQMPAWARGALERDDAHTGYRFDEEQQPAAIPPRVAAVGQKVSATLGNIFGPASGFAPRFADPPDPDEEHARRTLAGIDRLDPARGRGGYVPGERLSDQVEDRRGGPAAEFERRIEAGEAPADILNDMFSRGKEP